MAFFFLPLEPIIDPMPFTIPTPAVIPPTIEPIPVIPAVENQDPAFAILAKLPNVSAPLFKFRNVFPKLNPP
ncbi:hypothetical protein [Fusobacterium sp.]|uniref:hypothetical protein n=1 Tax=Fusobacterium sp. TaxID=68766 RepID=UPI0025B870A2|nr:hypothetical protein [Fusobacterium sp.]